MRIGFLAPDLGHHHGWGHYSLETIRAIQRAGHAVVVLAAHNSPLIADLEMHRLLPTIAPLEAHSLLKQWQLRPTVRRLLADCDLIHATAEPYAPLAHWVRGERPMVQGGVGSYVQIDRWQRFPATWLYRRAIAGAQLVCISHYTARIARQTFPRSQPQVVTLGVDAARFAELPPAPVDTDAPIILSVGGVKKRKGTLPLVRAVAQVREIIPDVRCVILGSTRAEDHYVSLVQAAIDDLHLRDCVHMPGFVSEAELLGWYRAASVFVLPSMNDRWKFEGFGLVHLEASAAGVPVIGTTGSGVEDAIIHGETGLLVDQARVETDLPAAILRILGDPAQARQMGLAGKRHAQSQTWDHVAAQTLAIYAQLLGHEPPPTRS